MYGVFKGEWIRGSGIRLASRPKPWVARLTGLSDRWGFEREFIKPVYDYTYARGKGSANSYLYFRKGRAGTRGIYLYFFLAPGIYEVYRVLSWKKAEQFFIRVHENGEWDEIGHDEVETCMKNAISV